MHTGYKNVVRFPDERLPGFDLILSSQKLNSGTLKPHNQERVLHSLQTFEEEMLISEALSTF